MRVKNVFMASAFCVSALSGHYQPITDIISDKHDLLKLKASHDKSFYSKYDFNVDYNFSSKLSETLKEIWRTEIISKQCTGACGMFLFASKNPKMTHFYIISAKDEKKIRWDKVCKVCRKNIRNNKEVQVKSEEKVIAIAPEKTCKIKKPLSLVACSKLLNIDNTKNQKEETKRLIKRIDFSKLEKVCSAELIEIQKMQAVDNFNQFISFLREEFKQGPKEKVYVKS